MEGAIETAALALVMAAALIALAIIYVQRQRVLEAGIRERERGLQALMSRFGESEDFVEFARSRDAQRLFPSMDGPTAIVRRLLATTAAAIVIGGAGIGFLINSYAPLPSNDINYVRQAESYHWWAVMLIALGLALAIATAVCAWLARRWGVLEK